MFSVVGSATLRLRKPALVSFVGTFLWRLNRIFAIRGYASGPLYICFLWLERERPRLARTLLNFASRLPWVPREVRLRVAVMHCKNEKHAQALQVLEGFLASSRHMGSHRCYLSYYLDCLYALQMPAEAVIQRVSQVFIAPSDRRELCAIVIKAGYAQEAQRFFADCLTPFAQLEPTENIFSILKVERLAEVENRQEQILIPASRYRFTEPQIFEEPPGQVREVDVPAGTITTLQNVSLLGNAIPIVNEAVVVHEPAAYPDHPFVSGWWEHLDAVRPDFKQALLNYPVRNCVYHKEGILLGSRCSENYFHWIIEYVSKLVLIEQNPELQDVPLVVPRKMHRQQFEALDVYAPNRPRIYCDQLVRHEFETLHIPSIHTYAPDRFDLPYWTIGGVSTAHIRYLRQRALDVIKPTAGKRRIYLSRKGFNRRKLLNEKRLESILNEHGFETVYPETMSFQEQVQLFHSAEVIAAPQGAALTNAIYCQAGAKVLCLAPDRNKSFCLHANVAEAAGCEFIMIAGANEHDRSHFESEVQFVFSAFRIEEDKLHRALEQLL